MGLARVPFSFLTIHLNHTFLYLLSLLPQILVRKLANVRFFS